MPVGGSSTSSCHICDVFPSVCRNHPSLPNSTSRSATALVAVLTALASQHGACRSKRPSCKSVVLFPGESRLCTYCFQTFGGAEEYISTIKISVLPFFCVLSSCTLHVYTYSARVTMDSGWRKKNACF